MGAGAAVPRPRLRRLPRGAGRPLRGARRRRAQAAHPATARSALCARAAASSWSRTTGLLDEVAGLAEWPVPVLGDMDPAFLDLPPEVIRTSMRTHQRYFAVREPRDGRAGAALRRGRQYRGGRRRRADRRRQRAGAVGAAEGRPVLLGRGPQGAGLEARLEKLKGVTFHAKLGTMSERVGAARGAGAASSRRWSAPIRSWRARPARLAKADLATGMVGEFPELQGVMGGYYAREPRACRARRRRGDRATTTGRRARATRSRPRRCRWPSPWPTSWTRWSASSPSARSRPARAIPIALRRAALGRSDPLSRLRCDREAVRDLRRCCASAWLRSGVVADGVDLGAERATRGRRIGRRGRRSRSTIVARPSSPTAEGAACATQGARHDLVDAVFALGDDDLVRIVRAGRGAGRVPGHRRRRQPARRLQARRQHPRGRGEEGRRCRPAPPTRCPARRPRRRR